MQLQLHLLKNLRDIIIKKQFHYRPRQALRVPGDWGSEISRQLAHEGGKFVSPLLPRKYSWYSFLLEATFTKKSEII